MLDLAGFTVSAAAEMDGTSFLPLLSQADEAAEPGRSFLIEYFPIPHQGEDVQVTTKGVDGWCTDPDVQRSVCPDLPVTVDSVNNTWACVRTFAPPARDTIFCHFYDATGYTESFVRNESNFAEYYDMAKEPWQLRNLVHTLSPLALAAMVKQLHELMACAGAEACAAAGRALPL